MRKLFWAATGIAILALTGCGTLPDATMQVVPVTRNATFNGTAAVPVSDITDEAHCQQAFTAACARVYPPDWGDIGPKACARGYTAFCPVPKQPTLPAAERSEIVLHSDGGAFTVPVSINGAITLQFTIDSGAADVSIPADVVLTLMRTGTIDRSDFLGNRTYVMADGSTAPSPTFRIRSLRVGAHEVRNVTGSCASSTRGRSTIAGACWCSEISAL
jgi:hypothetical protein